MIFYILTDLDEKILHDQYVWCFCFKQKKDAGTLKVTIGLGKQKCLQLKAASCMF